MAQKSEISTPKSTLKPTLTNTPTTQDNSRPAIRHSTSAGVFDMDWLEARTQDCLRFCQSILERGDGIRPCVLFGRRGAGENPLAVDISSPEAVMESAEKVARAMRMLKPCPEYALFVSDSYLPPKEGEKEKVLVETITIVAESILGSYTVNQEYYRQPGKQILFPDQRISNKSPNAPIFGSIWTEIRAARGEKQ